MFDYQLSADQRQYQELARSFVQQELGAQALSKLEQSPQLAASLYKKAWEAGLMNLRVPDEFGGTGLKVLDTAIIAEELSTGCTGFSMSCLANDIASAAVLVAGNTEQRKRVLGMLTAECCFAALSLSRVEVENPAHTLAAGTIHTMQAKRHKDEYVISGKTSWVINGDCAGWYYIPAQMDDAYTAFIVPSTVPGIVVGEKQPTLGWRCANLFPITFEEVRVSASCRLGTEGQASLINKVALSYVLPLVGSCAVGLARRAQEHAIGYSKTRHTFGQPICNYQGVSFMLADMAKDTEAARIMCRQAAWLSDEIGAGAGISCASTCNTASTSNGHDLTTHTYDTSLTAKTFAADSALQAATDSVQIFGGYGYAREYPVEKLMRDAKMFQLFLGTSIAAKSEIGKALIVESVCT